MKGNKNPNWIEKLSIKCLYCDKIFQVPPSLKTKKFCSKECSDNRFKPGIIEKIYTKKTFEKRSKNKIGKYIGENNPNWRDGISKEPYPFAFGKKLKEEIRKRDNYRCQECLIHQNELFMKNRNGKIVNYKLPIHHIDYNKQNCDENNLISLCKTCHMKTSFNRKMWTEYYTGY